MSSKSLTIKPVADFLFVKEIVADKKVRANGIILKEEYKKHLKYGEIISVGVSISNFQKKQIVLFVWGDDVGDGQFIIKQSDILAICQ